MKMYVTTILQQREIKQQEIYGRERKMLSCWQTFPSHLLSYYKWVFQCLRTETFPT
jgi:hypothetical protein